MLGMRVSVDDHHARLDRCKDLIGKGSTKEEIALDLGVRLGTIRDYIRTLGMKVASVPTRKKPVRCKTARRLKLEEAIIAGIDANLTLNAIGLLLDISRERVRQIVDEMKEEGILSADFTNAVTAYEAARRSGLSHDKVYDACKYGLVKCFKAYGGKGVLYRILPSELESLALAVELLNQKCCPVCRKYFHPVPKSGYRGCCSSICSNQRYKEVRKAEKRKGICNPNCLAMKIKAKLPKPDGSWLSLAEAVAKYNVTDIRFRHLADNGVLATRDHPTKISKGKPVKQVSGNQAEFISQVYHGEIDLEQLPIATF